MRYAARLVCLGLVGQLLVAAGLHARTMYVSDMFEVVMRSEKEIAGSNIIKILPTGTPLEVTDMEGSWATVQLPDDRTGYVLKRYLISRLPYKVTAERLQKEVAQQKTRLDTLTAELKTFREDNVKLRKTNGQQESQLAETMRKYDQLHEDASQYLKLKSDYSDLQQVHYDTQKELAAVTKKNQDLEKGRDYLWFLIGAGVMLAGWVIGMMTERFRSRVRRQSGYSYQLPR
jgi:SH3 domain protein